MMIPEKKLQVAILLYDGMTAIDAIGPYEVLQAPTLGTDVRFVAREKGVKRTDLEDSAWRQTIRLMKPPIPIFSWYQARPFHKR